MSEQKHKYRVTFNVRSYEVDHKQQATISAICNYFQEAAGLHAQKLKFDITDLQEKGLTWILYKLKIRVHSFPRRWETIRVSTWPSKGDGLRAYRDYELYDEQGKLLAVGLSQWMILNTRTKRPVKMPEELMSKRFETNHHVINFDDGNLDQLKHEGSTFITKVGLNDLDMNNHVNNVKYIDWVTGYNRELSTTKKCNEITIQYSAETNRGDKIFSRHVRSSPDTDTFDHTLFKNNPMTVIAKARTNWENV